MRPPVALALTTGGAASAAPATLTARPAQEWRDSVGVNTRLAYRGTPHDNVAKVSEALAYLGISHIRDGLWPEYDASIPKLERLADEGVTLTLGLADLANADREWKNPADTCCSLEAKGRTLAAHPKIRNAVRFYEHPNEPNAYTPNARCWGTPTFEECLREYARRTRALLDSIGEGGKPVVGPSYTSNALFAQVGPLEGVTHVNQHPYPGASVPGEAAKQNLSAIATFEPHLPRYSSEVGYHEDDTVPWCNTFPAGAERAAAYAEHRCMYNDGVPPDIRGSYDLRMLLEHKRQGYTHTDLYTIVDQGNEGSLTDSTLDGEHDSGDWGLYNVDWTPRPAVHAISNFQHTIGKGGVARDVPLEIVAKSADCQHLLYSRDDGAAVLVLWRNVSLWDRQNSDDPAAARLTPAPKPVRFLTPLQERWVEPCQSPVERQFTTSGWVDLAGDPILVVLR